MPQIDEILALGSADKVVEALKKKNVNVPSWKTLKDDYEYDRHEIVSDTNSRVDKHYKGRTEKASRLSYGMEELLVHRINQFMFTLPVHREYLNVGESQTRKDIVSAIEAVYDHAHIDTVNMKRGLNYFKSCEIFTLWYAVKQPNNFYGFPCDYKLKCKTYSPDKGYRLYPLFDDMDDMIAMSLEYEIEEDGINVTYFDTYTADDRYRWRKEDGVWKEEKLTEDEDGEQIAKLGKIPGAYLSRENAIYRLASQQRNEIEYKMSENSDTLSYNSSPILKVAGGIKGEEKKGDARKVYRVENGGDIGYVSWNQSIEALKFHVMFSKEMIFLQTQMPDISFENMKGIGDVGYDARELMFMDTYLKIGEEAKSFEELLTRESNVVKSYLAMMKVEWRTEIEQIRVKNTVTPYRLSDLAHKVEIWQKANGGKPLITHKESVEKADLATDSSEVVKEFETEQNQSITGRMNDIFGGGSAE